VLQTSPDCAKNLYFSDERRCGPAMCGNVGARRRVRIAANRCQYLMYPHQNDMFCCMRTTININDELLSEAKKQAAKTNRTLTTVIEDALRLALQTQRPKTTGRTVRIPTSGSGGLLPGVNLDDTSAVLDRMDGIE
jgi:hypothetical protein